MARHGLGPLIHEHVQSRKRRAQRLAEERAQLPPCDGCGEPSYDEVDGLALCYSCGKTAAKDDDVAEEPRELNFDAD